MKRLIIAIAITIALTGTAVAGGLAFKTGEQVGGTNKICFYSRLGNVYAITIKVTDICPMTIQVD